jgi:3-hydroxybutyryl-CoA dehydrogenase
MTDVHVPAIDRVGVIGCGQMGIGVVEVCARAGLDVVATDQGPQVLQRASDRLEKSLSRGVEKGKIDAADADAARQRVHFEHDLGALADRDLVVEAATEDAEVKSAIFEQLDKIVTSPDAILATNTSSIPIIKLGMATRRPEHVVGIHFFNPVPVLRLVEIVTSLLTDAEVTERAITFVEQRLDKRVIRSQDRAGFIVNALLVPYILSSIRMFESGFASREDIDRAMVLGCAHPLGPLALADLIGLDTVKAIAESLYEEFKEPLNSPPPMLARMVEAGLLGRKTGRGFYDYR